MGWLLALRPPDEDCQRDRRPSHGSSSLQLPLRTACGTHAYTPARAWEPHLSTCITRVATSSLCREPGIATYGPKSCAAPT